MARKGNHLNNGADRNEANAKNRFPGVINPSPSDTTGNLPENGAEILKDPSDGNEQEGFLGSLNSNVKGKKPSANHKKNCRVGNVPLRERFEVTSPTSGKSNQSSNKIKDADTAFTLEESSRDFSLPEGHDNTSESCNGIHSAEVHGDSVRKQRPSVKFATRSLSVLALQLLQIANAWVERHRPLINALVTIISDARSYMQIKFKHAYPIIRTWVLHLGKILLLFSMVWLNCSLRGFASLLHLGTTTFFTIVWCSFLSMLAMIGITKMLIILVMAVLVVFFIGLGIAILMVTATSAIILWFYGNFWTTVLLVILGGTAFALSHERVALFLTTVYSLYCVGCYMGWLGLFMAFNLSFVSSDILIYFLRSNMENQESEVHPEQTNSSQSQAHRFHRDTRHVSTADDSFTSSFERSTEHDAGVPSTSGTSAELTSEDEVVRLLNCTDHYSALGFARYESVDVSSLKREYRKKAMLVHPDKNMGNEKAAEAFKKLQNAYEVLLDSLKRKTYDDELRREEILNYFRRFQNIPGKNGRNRVFGPGFYQGNDNDSSSGEARRIACKNCGNLHIWIHINRPKSRARWCQDCKDFHQAKDGDGWVEQSSQPLMFGMLNKMDPPRAYVCADSKIYDATEWFICQGMRCPVNSHKPTFHINTSITSTKHGSKGTHSSGGGATTTFPGPNGDETMTEEELFEWLQNAMQSGIFHGSAAEEGTPTKTSGFPKGGSKKKRKGKKAW